MQWFQVDRTIVSWVIAGVVFLLIALGVPLVRRVIRVRLAKAHGPSRSWKTLLSHLNDRWLRLTTLTIALVCAVLLLDPDARVAFVARVLLVLVIAFQFARMVPTVIDWAILHLPGNKDDDDEESLAAAANTLTGLRWLVMLVAYSVMLLLVLQNLGVDVTAMIAGLGIGGVAIALATQNILGDLFASLTIALDKPFAIGDFIVVGNEAGSIEHVGLKTTRVRSLTGEQLVFSNSDLLSSRIRNYKRMSERRVLFSFGVVYETTPEMLQEIPALVRKAVESQSNVRFDRCHFFRFGESSMDFETVYYIQSADYNTHMDTQQAIHLGILRAFTERGIDFAFPTQTVHVASTPAPPEAPADTPNREVHKAAAGADRTTPAE